jgi:hypothetical protein
LAALKVNAEPGDALEISASQVERIEAWFRELLRTVDVIQAPDCIAVKGRKGEQVASLRPVPKNWQGVEERFQDSLRSIVGEAKAAWIWESSHNELTRRFCIDGRVATFSNNPDFVDQVPYPPGKVPLPFVLQIEGRSAIIGDAGLFSGVPG